MLTVDAPIFPNGFYRADTDDVCRPRFLSWADSIEGLSGELCQSIQEKLIRIFGDESIRLASALPKAGGADGHFLYSALKTKGNSLREMEKHPWPWHEAFKFVYVLSGEEDAKSGENATEGHLKMAFDHLARKYGNVTAEDMDSLLQNWIQEKSPREDIPSYLERLSETKEFEKAA